MIVLKSTYDALEARHYALDNKHDALVREHRKLLREWNALVDRINAKGGEQFLESVCPRFDKSELKQLVALCHPDKHGGSKAAGEITLKLLAMRAMK